MPGGGGDTACEQRPSHVLAAGCWGCPELHTADGWVWGAGGYPHPINTEPPLGRCPQPGATSTTWSWDASCMTTARGACRAGTASRSTSAAWRSPRRRCVAPPCPQTCCGTRCAGIPQLQVAVEVAVTSTGDRGSGRLCCFSEASRSLTSAAKPCCVSGKPTNLRGDSGRVQLALGRSHHPPQPSKTWGWPGPGPRGSILGGPWHAQGCSASPLRSLRSSRRTTKLVTSQTTRQRPAGRAMAPSGSTGCGST